MLSLRDKLLLWILAPAILLVVAVVSPVAVLAGADSREQKNRQLTSQEIQELN